MLSQTHPPVKTIFRLRPDDALIVAEEGRVHARILSR